MPVNVTNLAQIRGQDAICSSCGSSFTACTAAGCRCTGAGVQLRRTGICVHNGLLCGDCARAGGFRPCPTLDRAEVGGGACPNGVLTRTYWVDEEHDPDDPDEWSDSDAADEAADGDVDTSKDAEEEPVSKAKEKVKRLAVPPTTEASALRVGAVKRWRNKVGGHSAAVSRLSGNGCPIHTPDSCGCAFKTDTSRAEFPRWDYSPSPPPVDRKWPQFAMGLEFEMLAPTARECRPAGGILIAQLCHTGTDSTLAHSILSEESDTGAVETVGGELKIPSWDLRAPIHAARVALLARRLGLTVDRTCGFHVHADERRVPEGDHYEFRQRVLRTWMRVQPWVFKGLFPARARNNYCMQLTRTRTNLPSDHHMAVTVTRHNTIEFRASPGTTNWYHAYVWVEFVRWIYRHAIDPLRAGPAPKGILALYVGRKHCGPAALADLCYKAWASRRRMYGAWEAAITAAEAHLTHNLLQLGLGRGLLTRERLKWDADGLPRGVTMRLLPEKKDEGADVPTSSVR